MIKEFFLGNKMAAQRPVHLFVSLLFIISILLLLSSAHGKAPIGLFLLCSYVIAFKLIARSYFKIPILAHLFRKKKPEATKTKTEGE